MQWSTARRVAAAVLGLYCLALAVFLLLPTLEVPYDALEWVQDAAQRVGGPAVVMPNRLQFIANVLVVIPLTAVGSLVWRDTDWRDWTAWVFVLAVVIELIQGLLLPNRAPQFSDVVANTLGALTGGVIVAAARAVMTRRSPPTGH